MRRSLSLALVLLGCLDHDPAEAARHALLVANNRGWASEVPLQFAHQDVLRLAGTLQEIGGFEKKNITVLLDATPKEIDAALRRLASRIRGQPGGDLESLLLFYYSGHADDRALHPGPSSLPYEDLKRRIEEVPASVRLALLDSCKSGALTRLKGASLGPSFDVQLLPSSKVTGDVFISSASVSESAQESRQLGGSFFTTYVNTGLRGAADTNGDGIVTLAELYAFAYVMTVGRTSGTPGGIQHPTYRFDLRGRGELALTRPGKATACILFERGARDRRFNVLDAGTGALIAEVPASPSGTTRIGLDAGRYKVRRWTPGAVLEIEVRDTMSRGACLRGTAEAVCSESYAARLRLVVVVENRAPLAVDRQPRSKVEVAIVERAVPCHDQARAASQALQGRGVESSAEGVEIGAPPVGDVVIEATDRHVGQHPQGVKPDPIALVQLAAEARLELGGRTRKARSIGVAGDVEPQPVRRAVADSVQSMQHLDARPERTLAALSLH
jgi:hypothetical protein